VPVNFKIGQDRNSGEPRVLVQNQSGGPLLITVTATNPSTGNVSMARAAVDSSRNANLTALGLVVSPGDHITIKSPPYRDQSFDVR
jgi:hypothetical protein